FAGELHRACLAQALALLRRALAEFVVANRLGGQAARLHEGLRGVRCSGGETCNRHEESCQQLVGCFPHLRLPCVEETMADTNLFDAKVRSTNWFKFEWVGYRSR